MCYYVFVSTLLLMMTSLNSYRCFGLILKAGLCPVPLLSGNVFSLNIFFWSLEVWSQFFFFIPLSVCFPASDQPFPVVWIKRLCGCTMVRSVGQGQSRFKDFHCIFGSKPTSMSSWNGCHVWSEWDAFSTPHIHSKFSNSEPLPGTLVHFSWTRESDLWS